MTDFKSIALTDMEVAEASIGEVIEVGDTDSEGENTIKRECPPAPSREQQMRRELFLLKRELQSKQDIILEKDARINTQAKFIAHLQGENKRLADDSDPTTSLEQLESYAWKIFKAAEQKVIRDFTLLFELRSKLFPAEEPTNDMGDQVAQKCLFKYQRFLDKRFVVVPGAEKEEGEVFEPAVRRKETVKRSRTE
jgi:hypothetical protein